MNKRYLHEKKRVLLLVHRREKRLTSKVNRGGSYEAGKKTDQFKEYPYYGQSVWFLREAG